MDRDLFSNVSSPAARDRSSSRWTIAFSIAAHIVILALVVIVPLMAVDALPRPSSGALDFIVAAPTPPTPPAPRPPDARPTTRSERPINPAAAPIAEPTTIGDERVSSGPVTAGGVDFGGGTTGVVDSVDFGIRVAAEPEPPPPVVPTRPVRVGGAVRAPVRIRQVAPLYPAIAQAARVAGRVSIEAVIDRDGTVRDARVLSGSPLLKEAALDAVRQWRYTPTLLNNQPVQVLMTVYVDFVLH